MRTTGIYLVQTQIAALRINPPPQTDLLFTLRIGRNYTTLLQSSTHNVNSLQLNVDSTALEAQRCSLTINANAPNDKHVLGIALISLPKDKNLINNTYRLTQSQDKKAEIDLKFKISPIDTSNIKNSVNLELNSEEAGKQEDKMETIREGSNPNSNINLKSKKSSEEGDTKKMPKNYKLMEEDKVMEVTEKELKRYKDQKEAYYQMYQIQKTKNEVATKFITSVIKKLTEKYPSLLQSIQQPGGSSLLPPLDPRKKISEMPKSKNQADAATITQLEQANRSLHRQVDQYKKIIEQLKQQVTLYSMKLTDTATAKKNNLVPPPSEFDILMYPKQSNRERSNNIIPASLKDNPDQELVSKTVRQSIVGVDLKKWLELSIGQRKEIQSKLFNAKSSPSTVVSPERSGDNKQQLVKKLKMDIDKAFTQLLKNKEYTKPTLLSHKQEVNRILDQIIA